MTHPTVVDLIGRVKTPYRPTNGQNKDLLRDLMFGTPYGAAPLRGLLTDNDGAMAQGNDTPLESMHQQFWLGALVGIVRSEVDARYPSSERHTVMDRVSKALEEHLETCFSVGGQVIGGAFQILSDRGVLPEEIRSPEDLDDRASELRIKLIRDAIDEGRVKLMSHTVELFTLLRREFHVRIGMYTNNDKLTALTLCESLFGCELFNELIRETTDKPRRLFGSDVPRGLRKPNPHGWKLLADNMALDPRDCAIMEDRLNVIENALTAFPFRFAILVMAPENHHHEEEFRTKLAETRTRLQEWKGAPIVVVQDLRILSRLLKKQVKQVQV
jgi:beta-phosphoglucomutase-like phosphatase (HAD superfamily)